RFKISQKMSAATNSTEFQYPSGAAKRCLKKEKKEEKRAKETHEAEKERKYKEINSLLKELNQCGSPCVTKFRNPEKGDRFPFSVDVWNYLDTADVNQARLYELFGNTVSFVEGISMHSKGVDDVATRKAIHRKGFPWFLFVLSDMETEKVSVPSHDGDACKHRIANLANNQEYQEIPLNCVYTFKAENLKKFREAGKQCVILAVKKSDFFGSLFQDFLGSKYNTCIPVMHSSFHENDKPACGKEGKEGKEDESDYDDEEDESNYDDEEGDESDDDDEEGESDYDEEGESDYDDEDECHISNDVPKHVEDVKDVETESFLQQECSPYNGVHLPSHCGAGCEEEQGFYQPLPHTVFTTLNGQPGHLITDIYGHCTFFPYSPLGIASPVSGIAPTLDEGEDKTEPVMVSKEKEVVTVVEEPTKVTDKVESVVVSKEKEVVAQGAERKKAVKNEKGEWVVKVTHVFIGNEWVST
ncbi:hypothetical protein EBR25_13985, partial [bacterium]|nr:hypothetical protein [bacterium]